MSVQALAGRVSSLIESNWREKAEMLLAERKANGDSSDVSLSVASTSLQITEFRF